MSAIFGVCRSPGLLVDRESLLRMADVTARYGIDGTHVVVDGRIGMGFQAFHTHDRSRDEQQPNKDHLGNILILDGRLDNHKELANTEGIAEGQLSDSDLVLKTFARWGEGCFSRLVGDWSIALWSAKNHILYLARDHAGSRTLYYRTVPGETRWSTYLETFFVGSGFPELNQEYLARVISCHEVCELTPYNNIRAVPPAHYLAIREGQATLRSHWRWIADTKIVYRSDAEYDEHFLHLFRQAVLRRIVPGAPILAELSGGVDSSSIVCMADKIINDSHDPANQLNTISYYDDTEPDWDERSYFAAVEKQRHKHGIHLDCSSRIPSYEPLVVSDRLYPYLGGDSASADSAAKFEECIGAGRYRVILSGIGGDELLGGVPTPMPELANYLRAGRLLELLTRASKWCLATREPLLYMVCSTVSFTSHLYRRPLADQGITPPWLSSQLRKLCDRAPIGPGSMRERFAASPSALANGQAWWSVLGTLPHLSPKFMGCYEYRYPYLDRDLVEFLHRIPREQLVQPGRRRLLMRRALKGIVPIEILERKRKGFISHGPIIHLRNAQQKIETLFSAPLVSNYGLIDQATFLQAFRAELAGDLRWVGPLTRTIGIELWLRSLKASNTSFRFAASDHGRANEILPVEHRANKLRASKVGI